MQSQSVLLSTIILSLLVVTLEAVYGGSSWPIRRPVDRVYGQGSNVFSLRQKSTVSHHSGAVIGTKEKSYGDNDHRPVVQDRYGHRGKLSSPLVDSHNLGQRNEKLYSKPKSEVPLLPKRPHKPIGEPGFRPPSIDKVYGKMTKKVKTGSKTEPEIVDGIRVGELVSVGTVIDDGDVADIPEHVIRHPVDPPHRQDRIDDVSRSGSDSVDSFVQRQRSSALNRRQETSHQHESDWRRTQTHNNGLPNAERVRSSSGFEENPWPRRAPNERVQFDGPVWSDQHRIPKPVSKKITQGKRKLSKYDRLRRYEG